MDAKTLTSKIYVTDQAVFLRIPSLIFKNFFVSRKVYYRVLKNFDIEFSFAPSLKFRKKKSFGPKTQKAKLPKIYMKKVSKSNKIFWELKSGKIEGKVYNFESRVGKYAFTISIFL